MGITPLLDGNEYRTQSLDEAIWWCGRIVTEPAILEVEVSVYKMWKHLIKYLELNEFSHHFFRLRCLHCVSLLQQHCDGLEQLTFVETWAELPNYDLACDLIRPRRVLSAST